MIESATFDQETIALMRSALDAAWATLSDEQRERTSQTLLAQRILHAATQGERDPARLRARALVSVAPPGLKAG